MSRRERLEYRARLAVRDQQIAARYLAGASQANLALQFGLSAPRISVILKERGVRKDHREIHRLNAIERWKRGVYRKARAKSGRPPIWPDCPPHLVADYKKLRQYMSAGEARAALERAA